MGCLQSCVSSSDGETSPRGGQRCCRSLRCCANTQVVGEKRYKITGCTYLENGFLVIVDYNNKRIKLYDPDLKCRSYINLEYRPYDICAKDNSVYVTIPKKKFIQKFHVTSPVFCVNRKLLKLGTFPTEAECRSIASYNKELIVCLKFAAHVNTDITDSTWQIQIMSTTGSVHRRIMHDVEGSALIHDVKYICLTPNQRELVITEAEDNRVKCLNIESGELTFNHHMEDPKGVICDKHSNIYVLGKHGAIRWILADREYVKVLLNGTDNVNYSDAITYYKKTNTLAIPRNENKIELYKVKNSIHDG